MPVDRGWAVVMTDIGIDPTDVLRRAELPEDLFARVNAKVSVESFFRLWTEFTRHIPDPRFPIAIAESMSTDAFDPMVFAALCSRNFIVAAQRIAQYKRLVAPMVVTVEERADGFFIQKQWQDHTLEVPSTLATMDLLSLVQIARIGTRERINPFRVVSRLPLEPVEAYEAFFGVTPEVGEEHGLTFHMTDATKPFVTASETMWQTFEPELRRRLMHVDETVSIKERVLSMLLESLPGGGVSIHAVARRLGMTSRTLQRRLKSEGVLFKQLVQTTRLKLATHYLTRTELAYAEISFLVGFDEPSSFFRAFRSWTGGTPEAMRVSADRV